MKIILEGPDNSGKSTLAKLIQDRAKAFGIELINYMAGDPPANWHVEESHIGQQHFMLTNNQHILLDRATCISQQVYNPAIDSQLTVFRQRAMYDLVSTPDTVLVYCRPSTDTLMKFENFTWRDSESEEHKQKIIENQHVFIDRYDALMTRVPHLHYDFENGGAEIQIALEEWIRGRTLLINRILSTSKF